MLAVCLLPWIVYTAWSLPWRSPPSSRDVNWPSSTLAVCRAGSDRIGGLAAGLACPGGRGRYWDADGSGWVVRGGERIGRGADVAIVGAVLVELP